MIKRRQNEQVFQPVAVGNMENGKAYALKSNYYKSSPTNFFNGGSRFPQTGVDVPANMAWRGNASNGNTSSFEIRRDSKANTLTTGHQSRLVIDWWDGKAHPVYQVLNGRITIKGKVYPVKLPDGYYLIRKLTPIECERLQTLPDNYTAGVSNAQRYKMLGNGWTAEVIIHIMRQALKDIPRQEPLQVISLYDGMATGMYCLKQLGFTNIQYYAYEIDKYAVKIAQKNYPGIAQCGDAFEVRQDDWLWRFERA